MKKVSVLYVRRDSIYKSMGLDCWDIDRDARNYNNTHPVVAHPPCRSWGMLKHFAKPRDGEKELAIHAIDQVRRCGGVLEHPSGSSLWRVLNLPLPGQGFDKYGGWSLSIDQFWFGHKARKRTLLYIVGVGPKDIPDYSLKFDSIEFVIASSAGTRWKKKVSRKEREATPVAFANWLVDLADRVNDNIKY